MITTNNSINTPKPIDVSSGGTGQSTLTTAYGVLAAGTTATGAIQNIGTGASGQVLTSNGAGALPTFQAGGGGGGAMVLLHTITFDGTFSSVDLTSYVTGYDAYYFVAMNVTGHVVDNGSALSFEFSSDGGVTWIAAGYSGIQRFFDTAGGGGNFAIGAIKLCEANNGSSYRSVGSGIMSGYNQTNAGVQFCSSDQRAYFGLPTIDFFGSYYPTGTTLNGIRLINLAGTNFVAGKMSVYGIST